MKKHLNEVLLLINREKELILISITWFLIWSGYNTGMYKIYEAGFPRNIFHFIHGVRAFFPIFVFIALLVYLFFKRDEIQKNFFSTPLGLISIYVLVTIISSFAFSKDVVDSLYWTIMYSSVILFLYIVSLLPNSLKYFSWIINVNWVIAFVLTLFLTTFFFIQPGTIESLKYNIFICSDRPYERLGVGPEINTLGMAGTRPTGLARYAGVFVLIAFWRFLNEDKNKINFLGWRTKLLFFLLFISSFIVLIFSKGKTELIAFIAALFALLWFYKKFKTLWIILLVSVIFSSYLVIFYYIPCSNDLSFTFPFASKFFNREESVISNKSPDNVAYNLAPVIVLPPDTQSSYTLPSDTSPNTSISNPQTSNVLPSDTQSPKTITGEQKQDNISQNEESKVVLPESDLPPEIIIKKDIENLSAFSGRANITWPAAWQLFLTSPLIGYGFQADRNFLYGQHAHNTLVHTLVQSGLLGTIPFFLALVLTIIYLYRLFKNSFLLEKNQRIFLIEITAVLIFLLVRGLMESFAFYSADWLFIAPIIAYIQILWFNSKIK